MHEPILQDPIMTALPGQALAAVAQSEPLRTAWSYLRESVIPFLSQTGPRDLLYWQWIALPLLGLVVWPLARLAAKVSLTMASHVARRTSADWDDELLTRLPKPARLAFWLALLAVGTRALQLTGTAQATIDTALRTGSFFALFWALLRAVDIMGAVTGRAAWSADRGFTRSLIPLAIRASKVVIVALGVVSILSLWGYPVASLLAGLGLGGLAFALAAQKTVENLFGSFSIGVDQPFREGDFVKVEEVLGTVEKIGLRSTRIRTLDRTMVTLPNGKLADTRVETFAARDRIRWTSTIGVVYGTTSPQIREVLTGFERVLREHPKIWPDDVVVRFAAFGASSLDIEVVAFFQTTDFGEFRSIRQEALLAFMEVIETAGTSFAFPTRTVILEKPPRREPPLGRDQPTMEPLEG